MSAVNKPSKAKKIPLVKQEDCNSSMKPEPKKRAPRVKKAPPTKEESLKMLSDASCELKQIILDLKEDEMKLSCMQLKRVPELVKETINNLEEDVEEIEEEHQELLNKPESQ